MFAYRCSERYRWITALPILRDRRGGRVSQVSEGRLLLPVGRNRGAPLIRMVYEEGNRPGESPHSKEAVHENLGEEMPWLAARSRFTSFEMVKSFAILTISMEIIWKSPYWVDR